MSKYKKQIKRHILSQKDKASEHGWNEILVNQIKIKDVFLLKREAYPQIRKAAEKIASENNIEMPILQSVFNILYNGFDIEDEINKLMSRPLTIENI